MAQALAADPADPRSLRPSELGASLTVVLGSGGGEHAVLSHDGWRVRIDLPGGCLSGHEAVDLHFQVNGLAAAQAAMLPLQRLLFFVRHHRFAAPLCPRERTVQRGLALLRVHDALAQGAGQREIARVLFGAERIDESWRGSSDSLRSRVRRLAREARQMAAGGYRGLLGGRGS